MTRARLSKHVVAQTLLIGALGWSLLVGPRPPIHAADPEPTACTPLVQVDAASLDGLVPIQTLAQGNVFDHGPPSSLLVVSSRPDPIVAVIDPASWPAVEGVDLSSSVLVGLFIGRWPQDGYHVSVETVRVEGGGVCITAIVTGPGPDQDAADAETYPYHVVAVPRAALPDAPGTPWTVVSPDGNVLAHSKFP